MGDRRTFPNRGTILDQWRGIVDRHNRRSKTLFRYYTGKQSDWKSVVQVL